MKSTSLMKIMAVALTTCLLSCTPEMTRMQRVMSGEPIMPIRTTDLVTDIYITDYLPTLDSADIANITVSGDYRLCEDADGKICIAGNTAKIEVLSVSDGTTQVDIPILPRQKYGQGLTTLGFDEADNSVKVGIRNSIVQPEGLQIVAFVQNHVLPAEAVVEIEYGMHSVLLEGLPKELKTGRTYLRIYAATKDVLCNDMLVPLQDGKPIVDAAQLNRHDANAQILYSLMIDRFLDGKPENNEPLNSPDVLPRVDYMGGDLVGITKKIEEGFFEELGIMTIWISPISQNPTTAWGLNKEPLTKFSGYHGYWPIYNTAIDYRFGTDDELRTLLATAHKHNINVVLDYVANHMHIESPTLKEHPTWITDSILPDGRRNFELWDEARLTTWFDVHIPSLDLEREEVCDAMTDTALYWVANYDFDGYRHDACKHIPLNYWRMFTHKMKSRFPDRQFWMIGETYGDPELISSYVKTGMLNAQFDFNIYHTAIDVFGKDESMTKLAKVVQQSCETYGFHHTMGNISGNHDKTRFISLAGGAVSWDEDGKLAGWTREIGVTADGDTAKEERAFRKAMLLEVLNLTIPGVPCIYQGDEYGQCGANDPDNRRMMRFNGLSSREEAFREEMLKLTQLRRSDMTLMYGDYQERYCDDEVLVFTRSYMGHTLTIAINNGERYREVEVNGGTIALAPNDYYIEPFIL